MTVVVGVDLSLTSTGLARVDTAAGTAELDRVLSKPVPPTLAARRDRLDRIAQQVVDYAAGADLVVLEGPSLGQTRQGGQHDRAGLWWLVVDALLLWPVPVAEVPPANVKKYATGKGGGRGSDKDAVLAAVVRRYPDVPVAGNDQADALVLAAIGARRVGEPVEPSLPVAHLAAMTRIVWPDLPERVDKPAPRVEDDALTPSQEVTPA